MLKINTETTGLFTVNFAHLHYNEIQHVCEAISGLFCSFSPKLCHIHVGLHCNANEKRATSLTSAVTPCEMSFNFLENIFVNGVTEPEVLTGRNLTEWKTSDDSQALTIASLDG